MNLPIKVLTQTLSDQVERVVAGKMQTLYVRSVAKRKKWPPEYVRALLIDFLTTNDSISLYEFLEREK